MTRLLNEARCIKVEFDDLEYGDVFVDDVGDFLMKIRVFDGEKTDKDAVLDLQSFIVYTDVYNYGIRNIIANVDITLY